MPANAVGGCMHLLFGGRDATQEAMEAILPFSRRWWTGPGREGDSGSKPCLEGPSVGAQNCGLLSLSKTVAYSLGAQ